MDKRPQAVEEHNPYLIEDDKWAKKEYKEILVIFEQFRNKMQIGNFIE